MVETNNFGVILHLFSDVILLNPSLLVHQNFQQPINVLFRPKIYQLLSSPPTSIFVGSGSRTELLFEELSPLVSEDGSLQLDSVSNELVDRLKILLCFS